MLKVKKLPFVIKKDERGELIQNDHPQLVGKMKHFLISTTHKGYIRGNHYHKRKREWFCVFKGKGEMYLKDKKTGETATAILSGEKPEFIEIEPGLIHALKNIGNEDMLFFEIVDEPYDPSNNDTYKEKII